jgi:ribonuclease HI
MVKKYYVVWQGTSTGVFDNWSKVQASTAGQKNAQFMGFKSELLAQAAFKGTYTQALMNRALENDNKPTFKNTTTEQKSDSSKSQIKNKSADIAIYCDGACSPNPGASGTGIAVYQQSNLIQLWFGSYQPNGTNNTAELQGILSALTLAKPYIAQNLSVEILSDSKYSIDSVTKWAIGWQRRGWKKANGEAIKNPELVQACFSLYQPIKSAIKITHVKGHANIEGNELSDRMAVQARLTKTTEFVRYHHNHTVTELLSMPSG